MAGNFAEARIPLPLVCAIIDHLQDCAVCCGQYFDGYIVQVAALHCVYETLDAVLEYGFQLVSRAHLMLRSGMQRRRRPGCRRAHRAGQLA